MAESKRDNGDDTTVPKDVNFYGYGGTLLYSYTAAEFANLSALPDNPTHDGLTAQGWNWTLSDAKAYVAAYGKLNIGQMYVPDDIAGIPSAEDRQMTMITSRGEKYMLTATHDRRTWFLYKVIDGRAKRLGKSKTYAELKEKFIK